MLHALGARVVLTDMACNLPLLRANAAANASRLLMPAQSALRENVSDHGAPAKVIDLTWGGKELPSEVTAAGPFDLILATDVLYSREAVAPLVDTLVLLCEDRRNQRKAPAEVLLAAGRNRHAGDEFFAMASKHFHVHEIPRTDQHSVYQCDDVAVWRLTLHDSLLTGEAEQSASGKMKATTHGDHAKNAPSPQSSTGRGSASRTGRGDGSDPNAGQEDGPSGLVLDIDGSHYAVRDDGALQPLLADGSVGPVVGRRGAAGGITLDEAAFAGEWVSELLGASLTSTSLETEIAKQIVDQLPPHVHTAIATGAAAEWRGAVDSELLRACRREVEALHAAGLLRRENHAQDEMTRGDRVVHVALNRCAARATDVPSSGATEADAAGSDAESEMSDGLGTTSSDHPGCPPHLRTLFSLLECVAASVQHKLCLPGGERAGQLLTPQVGMVATYDGPRGYVRHFDNECDAESAVTQSSGYRNFRVLTVIAYLNDPDWDAADGGALRCYQAAEDDSASAGSCRGPSKDEECVLEVVPRGGTVVVFPSCSVPHEVMPSRRPRTAATLWFVSSALLQPDASSHAGTSAKNGRRDDADATGTAEKRVTTSWKVHDGTATLFCDAAAASTENASGEAGAATGFAFGFD